MPQSHVIFVTGHPGIGKTTLATQIADRFRLPLFAKDAFKEPMLDILDWTDHESTHRIGKATYFVLFQLISAEAKAGRSFIIESPFKGEESSPHVKGLQSEFGFAAMEVLCHADRETVIERFKARMPERHPGHFDGENLRLIESGSTIGRYDVPLDIDSELVRVDISDFGKVDYEGLFQRVDDFLSG